jgi:hypothetical protein
MFWEKDRPQDEAASLEMTQVQKSEGGEGKLK